jgi:hypothetical protein
MLEMEETIQAEGCADRASLESFTLPKPSEEEIMLASEIEHLWGRHRNVQMSIQQDRDKVCSLRAELGQRLSQMKEVLARPGRNGQWSAWLKEHKIPRANADRLVAKHARSPNPDMNCLSESISEPTEDTIMKLVSQVSSRLRKTLPGATNIYHFIGSLASSLGLEPKETVGGLLVPRPESTAPESAATSAEILNAGIDLPAQSSIPEDGISLETAAE